MILLLGLAAATATAGPGLEAEYYDTFFYLAPGPNPEQPVQAVHEMQYEGVEVHLLLVYRYGLYRLSRTGEIGPAVSALLLEYNDADRLTSEQNPFVPAPLQEELNPQWTGNEDEPGLWYTQDASNQQVERRLIFRFPHRGRYRLRITGLVSDDIETRRVPILIAVAEVRAAAEPEDEPAPEPEPEIVIVEEVIVPTTTVVVHVCPFCHCRLRSFVCIGGARNYHCSHCSGAVHIDSRGRRRCSVLRNGRRRHFDLRNGRPVGYTPLARPRTRTGCAPVARPTLPVVRPAPRPTLRPLTRTTRRPSRSTLPVLRPTRPILRPTRPVLRPTRPILRPTRPVLRPTRPVTRAARPVVRPIRRAPPKPTRSTAPRWRQP